jgi:hypothetical protein
MPRKTKVALVVAGGAVVALIAAWIALSPISITYRLWRYRRDPDAMWMPPLCAGGRANLPYIYAAFEKYGKDTDVAKFRAGIVAELRCIRRAQGEVTNEANAYLDLPEDPPLTSAIVRAYNQEPDAEIRDDMLVFLSEVDFRAWFEIYAGIAIGPYESKRLSVPTIDPYAHKQKGVAHDYEVIRTEWCRIVRPVVMKKLDAARSYDQVDLLTELGRAHCADSDTALLQGLAARMDAADGGYGAMRGLILGTDSVTRAQKTLVPLFHGDCTDQGGMIIRLEHELTPPVASLIATTAYPCFKASFECQGLDEPACLAKASELLTRHPRPVP